MIRGVGLVDVVPRPRRQDPEISLIHELGVLSKYGLSARVLLVGYRSDELGPAVECDRGNVSILLCYPKELTVVTWHFLKYALSFLVPVMPSASLVGIVIADKIDVLESEVDR